jgi:hypothetical protein
MATQDEMIVARRGGGRLKSTYAVQPTMVAGATVTDSSFTPPAGSRVSILKWHTGTAFTGSPTNINLTVGKTAGAGDYVAAVDVKGAGAPTASTLVAQPDYSSWPAGQALFVTLTAVGGTNPAGSCTVEVELSAPSPSGGNQPYGIN